MQRDPETDVDGCIYSAVATFEPVLQPKAIEILQAASARRVAANSMAFTAVVSYEGPSAVCS
jgi:hypothetical protein